MTRFLPIRTASLVALGLTCLGILGHANPAIAKIFGQKEVDQNKFVVLASPFGSGSYQLLVLEQLSNRRQCWSESGANPILVDPLLTKFDFTGICGRSTDSNGYSVRMVGRDFGLVYDLDVVRRENDLVLIATNITDRNAAVLEVGRTSGIPPSGQFAKFVLNPGWRLTKRTESGQELGHVYLTTDSVPPGLILSAFVDTQTHWARSYIDVLAARGIVSGFSEDNSFRPDDPVTRVQFAAIVNKAFAAIPALRASTRFKDVQSNFWGFQAIQTAFQKGFMSGYPDNTFKPNQQIPRLEVLVSLSSGLKYSSTTVDSLAFFQDGAQIPTWATGAIAAATDKKIVVNYPRVKELNPNRIATRAEVAAFVYQALVDAGQLPVIPSPYVAVVNPATPMAPASPNPLTSPEAPTNPAPTETPTPPISPTPPANLEAPPAPIPFSNPSPPAPEPPVKPVNPGDVVVPTAPATP